MGRDDYLKKTVQIPTCTVSIKKIHKTIQLSHSGTTHSNEKNRANCQLIRKNSAQDFNTDKNSFYVGRQFLLNESS